MMEPAIQWFELAVGDRDTFAAEVKLWPDPDPDSAEDKAFAQSWGDLALWVNGFNVCQHHVAGEEREALSWYLLEWLEWLVANWDPLLHEERLPAKPTGIVAAQTMEDLAARMGFDDADAFARWQSWWERHNIKAGEAGGLFPNLYLRRRRGDIEISWDSASMNYAPDDFTFRHPAGHALVSPDQADAVLWAVLSKTARALLTQIPSSDRLADLEEKICALESPRRTEVRYALMAGLGRGPAEMVERWQRAKQETDKRLGPAVQPLFAAGHGPRVIDGSAVAAIMFGSTSPNISDADVQQMTELMLQASAPGTETPEMRELTCDKPLTEAIERAWEQGYKLAEQVHEALLIDTRSRVDVTNIVRRLGVREVSMPLQDGSIRGASVCSPEHTPTILVNPDFMHGETGGIQRFTVAHELCHLLFDRDHAAEVAVASGPWAPLDIERRANAFAAMFLMPRDLVQRVVAEATLPVERIDGARQVISSLGLPATTVLYHLANLHIIDESTRDGLLEMLEIDANWRR